MRYDNFRSKRAQTMDWNVTRLLLTGATIDDDRFRAVMTLLSRAVSAGGAIGSRRTGGRHADGNGLFVQTNLETHSHVLFVVEQPDRILSIVGSSVLYCRITLRFASRRILLQLTVDNLASSAEESLEIPRA